MTAGSVSHREVSITQRILYREVPLYTHTNACTHARTHTHTHHTIPPPHTHTTDSQAHRVEGAKEELEHNDEANKGWLSVKSKTGVHFRLLKEEAEQVQADENVQLQKKGDGKKVFLYNTSMQACMQYCNEIH